MAGYPVWGWASWAGCPGPQESLDPFANHFSICKAEIIIVTYFTGGLMRINLVMSTEVFEDGMRYLRTEHYY